MAAMNQMLLSFAETGLTTFIRLYADVCELHQIQGPEPGKLHTFMLDELRKLDPECFKTKRPQEDIPSSGVNNIPTPSATEEPPSVAPVPAPQATAPKKVDVRDLKKLTYKKKRTITKGEKAGEEIEEDILVELPYLPHCVDYSCGCQALKLNGGLLNPCLTRPSKGSMFCKACGESPKFGTIGDRVQAQAGTYSVSVERIDAKTKEKKESKKTEISYGTWLQKQNIERSFVEQLLQDHGLSDVTIPESCFNVKKTKKRNTAKKSPSTSSDGEVSSVEEDAVSVEPAAAQPEPVVEKVPEPAAEPAESENGSVEEDVASVTSEAVSSEEGSVEGTDGKKKRGRPKSNKKPVDPDAPKKKRGRPKKESKPIVEEGDEEEEKAVEPPKAVESPAAPEPNTVVIKEKNAEDEDDSDVVYFDFNGKSYAYDEEYTIILINEEDPSDEVLMVGTWDPEENMPVWNEDYQP